MGIWESVAKSSEVKILLALREKGELRYSKLQDLFDSRATLDWALRQLVTRGLLKRNVVDARPIQSFYSLTARGQEAAKHVRELFKIVGLEGS